MSPNECCRPSRSRRGVWGHWVPLAVTLTVATVGVAAWVWSQRKTEDDEEPEPGLDYENADYGDNAVYGTSRDGKTVETTTTTTTVERTIEKTSRTDHESFGITTGEDEVTVSGWGSRMSGALRRTPSPQQFFDSTGKTITAGVAAASAAMGKALASIREEDKSPYSENNPWSEEAEKKERASPPAGSSSGSPKRRKTVAIVVSADSPTAQLDEDAFHEHASILSHIPRHNDFSKTKLFVLIYAPGLKDTSLEGVTIQTPGEETKNPLTSNPAFNTVFSQALGLVEKESMVLPFTTPNGHVHILRHLQPEVIYLQESLSGDNGSIITNLQTWLRHDVILVVGANSGSGGLADSESEAEKPGRTELWWQRPERVGRGRGIVVVDGMRVNDDWARRVQGQE